MAAIKSCHAKFPRAHAILIEDKANGPAIISELQKEIPGIIAINPEGGKIARAQATAPLWEAGSIELPDPQVFNCPWIEDYLHNICTFPKAAHDDDMDATSQALIYMRSRLGGGIVDFYRQQANTSSSSEQRQTILAQSSGSRPRPPRSKPLPSSSAESAQADALAQSLLAAIAQGSQIQCNVKQYPAIRAALSAVATNPAVAPHLSTASHPSVDDSEDQRNPSSLAQNEIDRLDAAFNWQEPSLP